MNLTTESNKVLFAYNGPVDKDEKGQYYGNELNDTLVQRYKFFGPSVSFLIRARQINAMDRERLKTFQSENFRVIEVPEFNTFKLFFKNKGKIDRIIRETVAAHDIVIARMPSYVGRKAVQFAREFGKPYFIEAVGCPWDALWNHSWRGKIFAPLAFMQMKNTLSGAPFVLYVTKKFLQERYPSKGLQTGVSDVVLKDLDASCLTRRLAKLELRKATDPLILGTAAAIDVAYKGQEYVIRAVARLKAMGIPVIYRIVGRGDKARLQQLVNELGLQSEVEIIGQITHDKVFDFLDNLDLYVQPSKQEGLPRAVVEAMSRACPCFGSRTGGIPELLNPALVFEKGDVDGIVEIVKKITPQVLAQEAKRSFEEAESYNVALLNQRRNDFYKAFQSSYSGNRV